MNYLFFDIECCDGYNICSFGYVLTDNNFKIIEKKDIVMNPKAKFKLGRTGFDPKIMLLYSEEYFKSQPSFVYFYKEIKKLLSAKNTRLLGHSVSNDILFLKNACKRYKLDEIIIQAFDTQNFYYQYNKKVIKSSLTNIAKDLGINFGELYEHKSCDDAEISMLYTKTICEKLEINIEQLLKLCENSIIKTDEVNKNNDFKNHFNKLAKNYPNKNKFIPICFSETIKEKSLKKRLELIKLLFDNGYRYTSKVSECSVFVAGDECGKRDLLCDKKIEGKALIKKISINELEKILKVHINQYGEIYEPTTLEMAYRKALKSIS